MSNQLDATIAKRFDITVKQNQTFDPVLTFIDEDNIGIDLLGATIKLSVRHQNGCETTCGCNGDTPFEFIYKQDFYGTIGGSENNVVSFNDTILLSEGVYKYDMIIVFADNTQKYFLTGTFRVKKSYASL